MIGIKNRLDQLAEQAQEKNSEAVLREITEVRRLIRESFDKSSG
jgi:hypothetical protein